MYNNEVFDDYIRQVLGYPNNIQSCTEQQYSNYSYFNNPNMMDNTVGNNNINIINENELESCYPEIYKVVYPMIKKRCSQINEQVTEELIEQITEEIASNIEPTETNDIQVNINLQNELNENRIKTSEVYKNTAISETSKSSNSRTNNLRQTQENQKQINENRSSRNNEEKRFRRNTLSDLIKILIIRELLGSPGGRPPRPPFPGPRPPFPGPRPPFPGGRPHIGHPPMPRGYLEYEDIYEI